MKLTMNDVLLDTVLIMKLLWFAMYSFVELLIRNLVPAAYLNKNIKGEIVLITGAAGGIGQNLVKQFLKLGCTVVCVDINESMLSQLESSLNTEFAAEPSSIKNRMYFYKLDITSSEAVKQVAAEIKRNVGKVDILVNNAGIMNQGKLFLELSEHDVTHIRCEHVCTLLAVSRVFARHDQ